MGSILEERRAQSESGLRDLRDALSDALPDTEEIRNVVIYITGSFGRLEARYPGSDLDIFFIYKPEDGDPRANLPRLVWLELVAAVIGVAKRLDFKPFSRDGEFLEAHNVFRIGNELGSRNEDADNGFTARLLLLLEGQYLLNASLYEEVLLEVIRFYYRDYPDKRERFRPYALVNDILRYWRTLCLQYEHQRGRARDEAGEFEEAVTTFKAESALANLKLRYSRLALCFSMVALLVSEPDGIPPERVLEMCSLVPCERWACAAERSSSDQAAPLVPEIIASYETFLDLVADEDSILARLRESAERRALRENAATFGDLVFRLIELVAITDHEFRRLVV